MKNVTPIILILISVVLGYFYIWPQYGIIMTLRGNQAVLADSLEKVKQIDQLHNKLLASINAISPSDVEKLSHVIPTAYNPIKLVADIQALGYQNGLVVSSVSTQIPVDPSRAAVIGSGNPYTTVQLTLSVKGSYIGFYSFLRGLESSIQLLDVRKVNVAGASKTPTGAQQIVFDISMDTYWIQ